MSADFNSSHVQFFLQESVQLARQMPIPDARKYIAGLLDVLGECEASDPIRRAYVHLDESDRQLKLLSEEA